MKSEASKKGIKSFKNTLVLSFDEKDKAFVIENVDEDGTTLTKFITKDSQESKSHFKALTLSLAKKIGDVAC